MVVGSASSFYSTKLLEGFRHLYYNKKDSTLLYGMILFNCSFNLFIPILMATRYNCLFCGKKHVHMKSRNLPLKCNISINELICTNN